MKRLALLMFAVCMGSVAFAGPFVGFEIVPSGGYAAPYLAVGWDGTWIKTTATLSNPLVADGWYGIGVAPLWNITPSWRLGGGINVWTNLCSWQFVDVMWSGSVEVVGKWRGILGWLKFNVPMEISPSAPLFGAWVVIGIGYDFFPCCPSVRPTCPDLGGGCD
jgi:hypothetical protein